ncbi:lipoate--protein ligase family protein [Nocardioides hwasunensis]|uniref:Lipoate--protein ligase family protein n=1 Tax=Nocardioides hwasunensis TaxID=397258 RepID=A0ABR8MJZ2_9ACTN|nr:lipoate--protein ligase family protein [Nocardioides hwasunensis]MBD3916263.1 lipoate--protein ligase family protein [Nocardioides hwasunensis]
MSTVFLGPLTASESGELAVAHALLRRASQGAIRAAVHLYRPAAPAVVFGRRDTRLPGYAAAVQAAQDAGFDTAVRAVGGRVVAYTGNALVLDVVRHEPQAVGAMDRRFQAYGELMAGALGGLGIEAGVGPVPGEYCPGAHSVNARGVVKLVGTAQRVVKDAWLFSSLLVVDDAPRLREVLTDVHAHLELPFDASSVGSVREEDPDVATNDVHTAVARAWGIDGATPAELDEGTRDLALDLEPGQRATPG